ncbi:MAG: EFR1 family ferrodoxin [Candidatus Methanomethylophilaceae archaeon]|nr:EFR1 family ferrodoxin [Candidatus Methanomethylophilaceae archaeon]
MIFYFTGTGNSLMAAKAIAEDDEMIVNMADALRDGNTAFELKDGERMGFIFPVYFYTVSDVVIDFIEAMKIGRPAYVFSVITCGGSIRGAGAYLERVLAKKGYPLDYVTSVLMPDDTVFYYNIKTAEQSSEVLRKAEEELETICEELDEVMKRPARGFANGLNRSMYHLSMSTKKFNVTDDCIHCGQCERICPERAIELREGKPVWVKSRCIKCTACINRCPVSAIQYGNGTKKRNRYVNPILANGNRYRIP